ETSDEHMDDITTRFEQCLRRHLRLLKQDSIDYAAELVQLGLDSMTAVALLLDMEKTFDIRFPDDMIAEDTFRTAGGLKKAVQQHLESALEWNRWQIEVFRREAVRVAQGLAGRGIHFVITKGMAFESTLYGSLGTRHMNDIDFMIAPRDREAVLSVMRELGFRQFF